MYYKRQQHKEFDIFIMLPQARQQEREREKGCGSRSRSEAAM